MNEPSVSTTTLAKFAVGCKSSHKIYEGKLWKKQRIVFKTFDLQIITPVNFKCRFHGISHKEFTYLLCQKKN